MNAELSETNYIHDTLNQSQVVMIFVFACKSHSVVQ